MRNESLFPGMVGVSLPLKGNLWVRVDGTFNLSGFFRRQIPKCGCRVFRLESHAWVSESAFLRGMEVAALGLRSPSEIEEDLSGLPAEIMTREDALGVGKANFRVRNKLKMQDLEGPYPLV